MMESQKGANVIRKVEVSGQYGNSKLEKREDVITKRKKKTHFSILNIIFLYQLNVF